jgi:hypothetical protein
MTNFLSDIKNKRVFKKNKFCHTEFVEVLIRPYVFLIVCLIFSVFI